MSSIMTSQHPRWMDFRRRLLEACLARECNDTIEVTRELLALMGCDVDASLDYFAGQGAYCDCSVLFEVGDEGERKDAGDMSTGCSGRWRNCGRISTDSRRPMPLWRPS